MTGILLFLICLLAVSLGILPLLTCLLIQITVTVSQLHEMNARTPKLLKSSNRMHNLPFKVLQLQHNISSEGCAVQTNIFQRVCCTNTYLPKGVLYKQISSKGCAVQTNIFQGCAVHIHQLFIHLP